MIRGEQVIGLFNSSDASTVATVTLYKNPGDTAAAAAVTARTLASNERLVVTGYTLWFKGTAADCAVIWDTDGDGDIDAGDWIARINTADGGLSISNVEICGHIGKPPRVKAGGAGVVDLILIGYIMKG